MEAQLPQNVDAEAAVLGSILIDPDAFTVVEALLTPNDFYIESHRQIYAAMCEFARTQHAPPDLITVCDTLEQQGVLGLVGGVSAVAALPNNVPTSRHAAHYARIVHRASLMRKLIHAAGQVAGVAYSEPDADVALAHAQAIIYEIAALATPADETFPIMDDVEAEALEPAQGILGDILYANSLAILYGRSGRWKSFLALSFALSIATGRPWLGRPVATGTVLYVAAEGGRGIGKRITAWKRTHGVTGATRLKTLLVPVQLLEDGQVEKLLASVRARCADDLPVLVVLDTLSRSMAGGDANASKDGSRAVEQAGKIQRAFGCCVLIVAHPGKDESRGISGWAGFFNAADTVMKIDSTHNNPRLEVGETIKLTSEKPKDAEPFADIALTTIRQAWVREDGAPVSSLVIMPGDLADFTIERPAIVPAKQAAVLDILRSAPGQSLLPMEWHRLSDIGKSYFFRLLHAWQIEGTIALKSTGHYELRE